MSAKARAFQQACRSRLLLSASASTSPCARHQAPSTTTEIRPYATQSSVGGGGGPSSNRKNTSASRRAVTVTTDDGRYNWSELSTGEKAARTTQQSFNFLLVAAGLAGTCLVSYYLYTDLFAPSSKTVQFNAAVNRVKASAACRELLGPASQIVAYGEPTSNKWARARPLAHSVDVDPRTGITHFRMHFNVEGPQGMGVVNVHMMAAPESGKGLEYRLLSLNVPGHEIVYLENRDGEAGVKAKVGKMFGVQWR